jgi:hypothetical protein
LSVQILIVGAGRVGYALGTNLCSLGHEVRYAVRTPTSSEIPNGASVGGIDDAARGAEVVILAVPFDVVGDVVARLGLRDGSILVDATNPFGRPLPEPHASGASVVLSHAGPGVRVVKAFNVLGAEHMTSPVLGDGYRPVLPVAGDDPDARTRISTLAAQMGFDAVEVGGLEAAGVMEDAARYWGLLAFAGGRSRQVVLVAHQRDQETPGS